MTPKSAKRLKADVKQSLSSPQVYAISSDLGTSSPNLAQDEGNYSGSRKKRKKQNPSDDKFNAISQGVAHDVSEWNEEPALCAQMVGGSVPDCTTANSSPRNGVEGPKEIPKAGGSSVNADSPMSNLELVRMLQDSKAPKSRKIEVAYDFVKNQETVSDSNGGDEKASVKIQRRMVDLMAMPQFVSFLSEWVQSAVLWSSKPQQLAKIPQNAEGEECPKTVPAHLDARYWSILRWCLSSGYLHKSASVSPSLMRSLNHYVIAVVETVGASEPKEDFEDNFVRSASLTDDCVRSIEVLLLTNERSFRPDLDHWVSLASTALSKLATVNKLIVHSDENVTNHLRRLLVCILEGFARFVAIHPNRRKIFTSLVENLLESLLRARAGLSIRSSQLPHVVVIREGSSWHQRLLQAIEDVLEKGLFHAAHVGSFQEVCTVLAGKVDFDVETGRTVMKRKKSDSRRDADGNMEMHLSYHRLLFKQLDFFRREGIEAALIELGWIFQTYSKSFRTHQNAGDVDVFGIRSKGKPQPLEATTNDGHRSDAEGEGSGKLEHNTLSVDKKDRNSETLFTVFAEFIGPLMKDLKSFHLSLKSSEFVSLQLLSSAKVLLGAVAGLLKAAKFENTYVPTEDNSSQAHFAFLDRCFGTLLEVGKFLPRVLISDAAKVQKGCKDLQAGSSRDNIDEHKLKAFLAELLREVIIAIKYLMELEYRVAENSLEDIWMILFAEVALQQSIRGDLFALGDAAKSVTQEAVEVACQMISIFSDLRQVDRALFTLCTTLRKFMSSSSKISHSAEENTSIRNDTSMGSEETSWLGFLNSEAIEFLVCAKSLLLAVSAAMHALPEGQVAEFLRLLRVDALESTTLIDVSGNFKHTLGLVNGYSGTMCISVGLKGLVELYSHMLENVNITSTNSILAGKAVHHFLMQIVTPKFGQLVDSILSTTCEGDSEVLGQPDKKSKYEKQQAVMDDLGNTNTKDSGKTKEDESLLNTWIFVFLLRLYMTTQSLHRECVSLMPPKAAKKASAELDGPVIDYHRDDITDILTHLGARSFLSGVGRGGVQVSYLLARIERRQDSQELADCPALAYALDCVALQSLVDLSRHIDALSFLIVRWKEVVNVMPNGNAHCSDPDMERMEVDYVGVGENFGTEDVKLGAQKKLQKLLKMFKRESQKLTSFLLKGVGRLEDRNQNARHASKISNNISNQVMDVLDTKGKSKLRLSAENLQQQLLQQSWDSVEATLTVDTLRIRRWNLLCKSFDIWSKYAVEEDLRKFLVVLFSTSLAAQTMHNAGEDQKNIPEAITEESCMKHITNDILSNVLFYEEESLRRAFSSTFLEELRKSLHSAFGKRSFPFYSSDLFMTEELLPRIEQEWSAFTNRIEADIGVIGQKPGKKNMSMMGCRKTSLLSSNQVSEQVDIRLQEATPSKSHNLKTRLSASTNQGSKVKDESPSNQSNKKGLRWSKSHLKALDHCIGLVDHLSALPSGYFKASECTPCAYLILCFERLLMNSLLDLRALGSSHGPGKAEVVDFLTVCRLLKAFSSCRSSLLALTWSEKLLIGNPPLMAILAGSFTSTHWLSLSVHTAATSLVDLLECSTLPAQQREDILSLGRGLLHNVLKSTASLLTYISDESLTIEARKGIHPEPGSVIINSKGMEESPEHISHVTDQKRGTSILSELIGYQVEVVDQLVRRSTGNGLNFAQRQADGFDSAYGIGHSIKSCYAGLALAASITSYLWSLNKYLEDYVKESTIQDRPLCLPTALTRNARKLGHVLTGTLLSALVPTGSHAILLLGEHEVDRTLNIGEETMTIRVVNQGHQEDNQSTMILDKDDDDDDDDDATLVHAAVAGKIDEEDDNDLEEEEAKVEVERDYYQGLEVDELVMKEEFQKYSSVTKASEELYTAQSALQRSLLESMLERCSSNKCDVIGELFLAMAGIVKLESTNLSCDKMAIGSVSSRGEGSQFQDGLAPALNVLMGAGYWLLLKAAEKNQPDQWAHLGWLVGVVKFMEAIYCLLPYVKPPLPALAFSKLFGMHIQLLGSLAPSIEYLHKFKSSVPLDGEDQQGITVDYGTVDDGISSEDKKAVSPHSLRIAVQESLAILLRTASRHHSVLALQSIMRALVGVEDSGHNSGLEICGLKDGNVGRHVAAGVECLLIALEAVSGTKRLRLLANHFNEFFGAIFNLMEYLQGPHLFQQRSGFLLDSKTEIGTKCRLRGRMVESGPVILQALQILVTAASRDTVFSMKACHVALALHCPARIFWPVHYSGLSNHKLVESYLAAGQPGLEKLKKTQVTGAVRIGTELGVKLYVLCCRLLCSLIRHRRRESGHCIAILGDSVRVLLQCLEAPNWPLSANGSARDWSIRMAAYCASWLRRIYEEMGEHKETLGKYCSHMLSDYLCVLSGYGPHTAGLMREVEAALQPGAYVLVDACSANDLQQLHASLGEGPRRNALLNLRRRYQQQFKYTGKV